MNIVRQGDSRIFSVAVEDVREACILDVDLPLISLRSWNARRELRHADTANTWPVEVLLGQRALNAAADAITLRANLIKRQIRMTFLEDRPEPEVDRLREVAQTLTEAIQ